MSAISLKSITGITSITTPAGVDNQLTLHTNNTTERVKIDVAGNVHVNNHLSISGLTTATGQLTAAGNIKISNTQPTLIFDDTNHQDFTIAAVGNALNITDANNGNRLLFNANGSNSLYGFLSITGNLSATGIYFLSDEIQHTNDSDTKIRFPATDTFSVETAGSERLRIASNGRIGIGTDTNFTALLNLHGVSNNNATTIRFNNTDYGEGIIQYFNGAMYIKASATTGDKLIRFDTSGNPRLTITSTGRIQIGSGSGVNASAPMELQVSSSSSWGDYPEHITLTDQKAYNAADNGAGIQFGGKYNNAGNATTFGSIHGKKATTGDGNFGGILTFNTREHGNSNFERMRIDSLGRVFINAVNGVVPTADYRSLNIVAHAHSEAAVTFSRDHSLLGSGNTAGKSIILLSDGALSFQTHNVGERLRIDQSGRVVIGGTSAYIGGANLAVMGTGTTQNTYGSFAIGKIGANPTAGTTLANIRLNGGSIGTRRGAEINAVANGNWSDGSSHPTNLTFAVANSGSASATQRVLINSHGHFAVTNENVLPASGSPGTNGFKGLTQLGYQHWGHRQYYSGQFNLSQNGTKDLISNNSAHDDIIFWLNIKGFHSNRTFSAVYGTIGGYGLNIGSTVTGVANHYSLSASNIGSGRNVLRFTSTSPYGANWWVWGWYSGTTGTGTHTGWSAAQLH